MGPGSGLWLGKRGTLGKSWPISTATRQKEPYRNTVRAVGCKFGPGDQKALAKEA